MARRKPVVSYLRASRGLDIEAQREANRRFAEANRYRVVEEMVESGRTETLDRRPRLSAAVERARREGCPILVAGLECLSRDSRLVGDFMARGVSLVVSGDHPLTLRPYRTLTDKERALHGKRVRGGQAVARAQGTRFGNPANLREAGGLGRATMTERAVRFAADVLPVIENIRAGGVTSLNGFAEELNRRGVGTPRGGRWKAMTVKRVVERGSGSAKG